MSVIEDLLDAVADSESGLFDALDAFHAATTRLERASQRYDGSPGAEAVYERATAEEEHAKRAAFEALAGFFDVEVPARPVRPVVVQSGPVDWRKGRAA